MSKYPFFLRWTSLSLTTVLAVAMTATTHTRVLGSEAARLDGFSQADGTNVFALDLKPSAPAVTAPREVVILVSTAASQTGDFRAKSLATLQSTLARLSPADRVKLVAFDLSAVPLTKNFVAPNSPEMASAIAALNQRTPLGSCDLAKALNTAAGSFSADGKMPRAVVYIGDGSSRANMLSADQLDQLINGLVAEHVPVNAFGVGSRIDEQLLGILASRTGGVLVREGVREDADSSGTALADAVRGTVLWPKAGGMKWPEGVEIYPLTLPPVRSDRDTVLVGTAKAPLPKQFAIDFDGGQKLAWEVPPFTADPKNSYLVNLIDRAKVDGGRTLPLSDSDSLANIKQSIDAGGRGLDDMAREAFNGGNTDSADKLADEALRRDPNDIQAKTIKDAIAKKAGGGGAVVPLPGAAPAAPAAAPKSVAVGGGDAGDVDLQGDGGGLPPPAGAAANEEINQSNAAMEQMEKKVTNAINDARKKVSTNPDEAEQIIQQQKQNVLAAKKDASADERYDRLLRMLDVADRDIKHRREVIQYQDQQRIREETARKDMEMTNEALQHDERKVKQLMDRFDVLMADGRHKLAEEAAGMEASKIVDRAFPEQRPTMVAAANYARFKGNFDDIMAVRVAKQKGFVDSMFQTEKSHVPVPDDPPIVYPDAETWKELTARRKEKYSATELSRRSPAEKKIEEALKSPTSIEFVETPLKDVVEYLKDVHKIEIQLDSAGLKDAGIDESTPVTKNIKGISLRSALRLLLDELQLKYVIHNEVLLITSPQKAESDEFMTTKVYPVSDLVLPIPQMGLSGMGGLGGGMGGGGQGGVGGMFGGGGMGGMGGGGGFGGGGGGMGGMGMGGGGMGGGGLGGMMGGGGMGGGGGGGMF